MQLGSEPWIPDKQILEICHCRSETILLTPNSSCEACSAFTRVAACTLARSPYFVTRYPKASDISSPPCLLRLLPAGAVAGWDLHPMESAAFSRRTPTAEVRPGRVTPSVLFFGARCAAASTVAACSGITQLTGLLELSLAFK